MVKPKPSHKNQTPPSNPSNSSPFHTSTRNGPRLPPSVEQLIQRICAEKYVSLSASLVFMAKKLSLSSRGTGNFSPSKRIAVGTSPSPVGSPNGFSPHSAIAKRLLLSPSTNSGPETSRENSPVLVLWDPEFRKAFLLLSSLGEISKVSCFDIKIPKESWMLWGKRYEDYRREMSNAMSLADKEVRNTAADAVTNHYKLVVKFPHYMGRANSFHSTSVLGLIYDLLMMMFGPRIPSLTYTYRDKD